MAYSFLPNLASSTFRIAETANAAMLADDGRCILAVAVCTENGLTPCGACRQVLSEFTDDEAVVPVWIVDGQGGVRETTLSALLPDDFGARHLR